MVSHPTDISFQGGFLIFSQIKVKTLPCKTKTPVRLISLQGSFGYLKLPTGLAGCNFSLSNQILGLH